MNELKKHVERIVRPLEMSDRNKLKLREELLCHLTEVYEEELNRLGDSHAAQLEALRRFGGASELTEQLRSSTPWYDFLVRVPGSLGPLWLWACFLFLVCEISVLVLMGRVASGNWFGPEIQAVLMVLLIGVPILFGYLLAMAGACHGVLGHRRSNSLATFYTAIFLGLVAAASQWIDFPVEVVGYIYPVICTLVLAASAYGLGYCFKTVESKLQTWNQLDLG